MNYVPTENVDVNFEEAKSLKELGGTCCKVKNQIKFNFKSSQSCTSWTCFPEVPFTAFPVEALKLANNSQRMNYVPHEHKWNVSHTDT